jgi:uncharacterized membrane protein
MLDIIFVLLMMFTIILMLYSIMEKNNAFCVITAVLWFILALFMLQGIEIPYNGFNTTSGDLEVGLQNVTSNLTPLSYLFTGLGALMFLLFVTFTLELFSDEKKWNR